MKTSSNLIKFLACVLIIAAFSFSACKKDYTNRYSKDIYGPWIQATEAWPNVYKMSFYKERTFSIQYNWKPGTFITLHTGTLTVKGDSAFLAITQLIKQGDTPERTQLRDTVYAKTSYSIRNDTIILNFPVGRPGGPATTPQFFVRPPVEY